MALPGPAMTHVALDLALAMRVSIRPGPAMTHVALAWPWHRGTSHQRSREVEDSLACPPPGLVGTNVSPAGDIRDPPPPKDAASDRCRIHPRTPPPIPSPLLLRRPLRHQPRLPAGRPVPPPWSPSAGVSPKPPPCVAILHPEAPLVLRRRRKLLVPCTAALATPTSPHAPRSAVAHADEWSPQLEPGLP